MTDDVYRESFIVNRGSINDKRYTEKVLGLPAGRQALRFRLKKGFRLCALSFGLKRALGFAL